MLNKTFIEHLIEVNNITRRQIIYQFLNLWVTFSKMISLIFYKKYSEIDYNNLQQILIQWAEKVAKVIKNLYLKILILQIQYYFIN